MLNVPYGVEQLNFPKMLLLDYIRRTSRLSMGDYTIIYGNHPVQHKIRQTAHFYAHKTAIITSLESTKKG